MTVEQVVALFDYTAQNDDELSFLKDSVINVISKDEASWWKGELNGQMGMFPANYITPLSAAETDDPATSPATVSCKYLISLIFYYIIKKITSTCVHHNTYLPIYWSWQ